MSLTLLDVFTRETLENTPWAKDFKTQVTPNVWEKALEIITKTNFRVVIYESSEREEGDPKWVVSSADDFWFEVFDTQDEALDFCKEMHWPVSEE